MEQNKVIKLLNLLPPEEIRLLDKFVRSPVHNRHEAVISLFQYLRKHLGGKQEALAKEKMFAILFPGQAFDAQQLHHVNSYLLKVMEEFLAWREWRQGLISFEYSLLDAYHNRRYDAFFEPTFQKTEAALRASPLRDARFHYLEYRLLLEKYNFGRKTGQLKQFGLQDMSNLQDVAFIAEKLKNACILLSHQALSKESYDTGLLPQVLAFLEGHAYLDIPALAIYYYAYRALSNVEETASYYRLKALIGEHSGKFRKAELHDIHIFLLNYGVKRLNLKDHAFMKEVFETYKSGLEAGVFLENGTLLPRTYTNIVLSGLRTKEYGWVEQFLHGYREALPDKHRASIFNYNLALLYYERKNYRLAMPLLQQIEHEDVLVVCFARMLLAKMYYELNEFDALASLLQSFATYLHRKQLLGYHKESFKNFISFLKKLSQVSTPGRVALQAQLDALKVVAERDWLVEQVQKVAR